MPLGRLFHLQRCSFHDGPGLRTTVFLKGCPLRCAWCHNPESWSTACHRVTVASRCLQCGTCHSLCPSPEACAACDACVADCPTGARQKQGWDMASEDLVAALLRDRVFMDTRGGVTFSGGEPLMQAAFVADVAVQLQHQGIHTALDTCGEAPLSVLQEAARSVDLVLYDVKHVDDAVHRAWTGVGTGRILENLHWLMTNHPSVWIRIPLVPGFNDSADALDQMAAFLADLRPRPPIFLLPYHPLGGEKGARLGLPWFTPDREADVAGALGALRRVGLKATVGGAS